jgi:hypothetical protein
MQLSAQNQSMLNRINELNINIDDTPFNPQWGTGEPNITVRNAMRDIALQFYFSNDSFFNAYPNLTQHKDTFFAVAVEYGNQTVAEAMLNEGASINGLPDANIDEVPFAYALRSRNESMIRWMLSHPDLDPNVIISARDEPNGLSYAIEQRMSYDIIESMVEHGALEDYNEDLGNWYPLSMAVNINNYQVIQLLLFYGADPHYVDDDEQDVVTYAYDDRVRQALLRWTDQTTLTLRQMAGNDPAGLRQNSALWLEAVDAEFNQGVANIVIC